MNGKYLYRTIVRKLITPLFPLFEALGVHVTPVHFYQPIPDTGSLDPAVWSERSELAGIDMNEQGQVDFAREIHDSFHEEYDAFPREMVSKGSFYLKNPTFGNMDAEVLYAMVRRNKPKRVIEVGSGYSSLVISLALQKSMSEDPEYRPEYTIMDPYPTMYQYVKEQIPDIARIVLKPVEEVPLSDFASLEPGDIVFIDTSHVVRIGGDVNYEYLKLLPKINSGVYVHLHDIFLPAEYPKNVIIGHRWFWTEQYILQAFLTFNSGYTVVWGGNFMCLKHPAEMAAAFASYQADKSPGSFWIRRN